MNKQQADLTFKHNLKQGRHGWLRLTPAYSVKLVHELLNAHPDMQYIRDPFAGTGTTGLVCAERGIRSHVSDINPFLLWLIEVKTAFYSENHLNEFKQSAREIINLISYQNGQVPTYWTPPLHHIERWWDGDTLELLSALYDHIGLLSPTISVTAANLLKLAFCRVLIDWSNAAFNHQSMSFKSSAELPLFNAGIERELKLNHFLEVVKQLAHTADSQISCPVEVELTDARRLTPNHTLYDGVITSPPYLNRMSYIRELRPYMYWLGYLMDGREAGEYDWQAIGGTWGIATSRLKDWRPPVDHVPFPDFKDMLHTIHQKSPLLANYVHNSPYADRHRFSRRDMACHVRF